MTARRVLTFDCRRIRWAAFDAPMPRECSYCGAAIDHDEHVPLMAFTPRGDCAIFCRWCEAGAFLAISGSSPGRDDRVH